MVFVKKEVSMYQPLKYIMKGQEDKTKASRFEESRNKHREVEIVKLTNISNIINSSSILMSIAFYTMVAKVGIYFLFACTYVNSRKLWLKILK